MDLEVAARSDHESGTADGAHDEEIVDIFGVGFGPANLSLAIAIEEANSHASHGERLTARFCERQRQFGWHTGMLLPGTTMQVSFIKDLATLRSPTSPYTFLNYLQEQDRLPDFVNLKTFFPTRLEFHDYLTWAAHKVPAPVDYATGATRIQWSDGAFTITLEDVTASAERTYRTVRARHVVLGLGIQPSLPEGIVPSQRVFHNHDLIGSLDALPRRQHDRYVVVGSGQSAAEVATHLHETRPSAQVHAVFRRFGYAPSDDTPYANRIFDPSSVDHFYDAPEPVKERLLHEHWHTNYSAVDAALIEDLYAREYAENVCARRRLVVHRMSDVAGIDENADGVTVTVRDLADSSRTTIEADAVVFATGFTPRSVTTLLDESLSAAVVRGMPVVDRDYRLRVEPAAARSIFLNGGVEHTHGLSSSLLSNMAVRAADILASVTSRTTPPRPS